MLKIDVGRSALEAAFAVEVRMAKAVTRLDLANVADEKVVELTYGAERDPKATEALYARWYVMQPPDAHYADLPFVEFVFDQPDTIALHFTSLLMRAVVTGRGLFSTLPEWKEHVTYCRLVPSLLEEFWRRVKRRPVDAAVLSIASLAEEAEPARAFSTIRKKMLETIRVQPPTLWELDDVLNDELVRLVKSAQATQARTPGGAHLDALRGRFGAALFTSTRQGLLNFHRNERVRTRHLDLQATVTEVADPIGFPRLTLLKGQARALEAVLGKDGLRILRRLAAGQRDRVQIAKDLGLTTSRVDLVIRKAKKHAELLPQPG